MRANIQKLNMSLPYCDAQTDHEILFVFRPPASGLLHVGDVIEFDPHILDTAQSALHVESGERFSIEIHKKDVHDLRLPAAHGSSRFPSRERLYDDAMTVSERSSGWRLQIVADLTR
jgi:hypothetical protein